MVCGGTLGSNEIGRSKILVSQSIVMSSSFGSCCTDQRAILAENVHPFNDPALRLNNPPGLFRLAS